MRMRTNGDGVYVLIRKILMARNWSSLFPNDLLGYVGAQYCAEINVRSGSIILARPPRPCLTS